jgi:hypothetical protein
MTNCLIGSANAVLTGTLSAGSQQTGLTIGNLQTQHGSAAFAWRTAAGIITSAAGAWFTLDSGSAASTWRAFALARTNLTTAATVRWRVGTTLSGGDVYDSGTVSAGIAAGVGQSITATSAAVTGRYLRCDIDDATNPDAYISVPLAFCGPAWQPAINYSPESTSTTRRGRQDTRTRGGGTYVVPLYTERAWTVAFSAITSAELAAQVRPADLAAADGRNCLFVPDPAATTRHAESVLGPMESTAEFGFATLDGARRSWRMSIVERL